MQFGFVRTYRRRLLQWETAVMVDPPLTRYAKAPGGNVAYQVVGDGPRDMIVVPGWFSHLKGDRSACCSQAPIPNESAP